MSKIKGLRKKTDASTYGPLVPFGTDGILVDMFSDLTLEEELKLGGNHVSAIDESGNNTIITESFKKGNNNDSYYTVVTTITENQDGSTSITVVLTDSNNVSKTKTITIPAQAINNVLTIGEVLSTS